ncbi:MAG: aminotransferase class III-fold pyridoxal phosphate-dependent enzyme [Phycisphaerales bacterium]
MNEASSTAAARTMSDEFRLSPAVRESIDRLIEELESAQSQLTAVRGPIDEAHSARFCEMLSEACRVRGKEKLYFNYIGSGFGAGPFVELADGSVKLDMINGIGVHFFGHSDPGVTRAAIEGALGDMVMQGNLQANEDSTEFGRILVDQASKTSRLEHAFITNSGAMANESALKICYQKNQPASRVLAFEHCFMGRSVTMCQIGDSPANRQGVPLSTLVDYVPFYDAELGEARSVERSVARLKEYLARYPKQHACFIFELVQGEGGFNRAPRVFLSSLMEICQEHGVAVWADEVQTFGRTGEMFGFDTLKLGEYIDVCTIGKMSQVCACLFTKDYNPKPGLLSGTFIGSTVGLNAGAYILRTLRDGAYYGPSGSIAQHFDRFVKGVRDLAAKNPDWFPAVESPDGAPLEQMDIVGGLGGMMRFTPFAGRKDRVMKLLHTLFDEGVIAFYCGHGPYHIRFLPPLGVMKVEQWDAVFEVIERALTKVAETTD